MKRISDAALFERVKQMTLAKLASGLHAWDEGKSFDEWLAKEGLKTVIKPIVFADLREIGSFEAQHKRRSERLWVYRHRTTDVVFTIAWQMRLRLQQQGVALMNGFITGDTDAAEALN